MLAGVERDFIPFQTWSEDYNRWDGRIIDLVNEEIIFYDRLNEKWWHNGWKEPMELNEGDVILFNDILSRAISKEEFNMKFSTGVRNNKNFAIAYGDTLEWCRWFGFDHYDKYPDWLQDVIYDGVVYTTHYGAIWEDEDGRFLLREDGSDIFVQGFAEIRHMLQSEFDEHFMEVEG